MNTDNNGTTLIKILIVDDSRSSRMMVKNCLKGVAGFEFEIEEGDRGPKAVNVIKI